MHQQLHQQTWNVTEGGAAAQGLLLPLLLLAAFRCQRLVYGLLLLLQIQVPQLQPSWVF